MVMGGTNDTTEEGVRKGLVKLKGKLGNSKNVVIVGVPNRHDDPYPGFQHVIERKNDTIKAFCNLNKYMFLNVNDSERRYFTKHGLHFNMTGKRWLAKKIQNAVNFLF